MELKEQGAYDFDPTKMSHVLKLARTSGLRETNYVYSNGYTKR